jgi:polyhydroxyalkanoate synthase
VQYSSDCSSSLFFLERRPALQPFPGVPFPTAGFPGWLGPAGVAGFVPEAPAAVPAPDVAARRLAEWAAQSAKFVEIHERYCREAAELWVQALRRSSGTAAGVAGARAAGADRRFAAPEWQGPFHGYLSDSYLRYAAFVHEVIDAADVEPKLKGQLRFVVRQALDAMSPANFAATNPEVIRVALETNGESLARGLRLLIGDVEKGRISQTDESAFAVGRNLAATPGQVIFRNALVEILLYTPETTRVHARPLVIVPPCINKYYVLDLTAENSFVRHAVAAGQTVFMISWRNPDAESARLTWDDYLRDGVLQAITVARKVTGGERVNVLGFCVGGTLASTALAVLAARGERPVASLTLLTTLLDFSDAGEIGLMIDAPGVAARERAIGNGGLLDGRELAAVFSTLRANDLVWPYVVNGYLKGRPPAAFDILYWNADSTHLPGPMYCSYVRNTYLENKLRDPGALTMLGEPVDLGRVEVPAFVFASRDDHIVPWTSAYRSTALLGGETRFVLGASGHIAGVINPPRARKRSYWTNDATPGSADDWLAGAAEHRGSWWPAWIAWLERYGGGEVPPPDADAAGFPSLAPAPGEYVRRRLV